MRKFASSVATNERPHTRTPTSLKASANLALLWGRFLASAPKNCERCLHASRQSASRQCPNGHELPLLRTAARRTIGLLNPSGGRRIRSESPYALINEHWPHTAGRNDAARTSLARSWYPCIRVRSSRTASPDAAANSRLRQILTFVGQRGRSHSGCCSASSCESCR